MFKNPSIRRNYFNIGGDGAVQFNIEARAGEAVVIVFISADFSIRPSSIPQGYDVVSEEYIGNSQYQTILVRGPKDYDDPHSIELNPDSMEEGYALGFAYTVVDVDPEDPVLGISNVTLTSGDMGSEVPSPNPELSGVGKQLFIRNSVSETSPTDPTGGYNAVIGSSVWGSSSFYNATGLRLNGPNNLSTQYTCQTVERLALVDYDESVPAPYVAWTSAGYGAVLTTLVLRPAWVESDPEPEEPCEEGETDTCNKSIVININCCKE